MLMQFLEFKNLRKNETAKLYFGDSRTILSDRRRFAKDSIDLIITSPPYGDNATTITYGQYSVLPLRWIPLADIHELVSHDMVASLTRIDRDSLGGIKYSLDNIDQSGILESSKELNTFFNSYYQRE